MTTRIDVGPTGTALPIDRFWPWLQDHSDCIVRAGTREAWLYDQDDLHWHVREERGGRRLVQLLRGKQILGEIAIEGADVMYVEMSPSAEAQGQFEFQLIGGDQSEMFAVFHVVMLHGYEEADEHRVSH